MLRALASQSVPMMGQHATPTHLPVHQWCVCVCTPGTAELTLALTARAVICHLLTETSAPPTTSDSIYKIILLSTKMTEVKQDGWSVEVSQSALNSSPSLQRQRAGADPPTALGVLWQSCLPPRFFACFVLCSPVPYLSNLRS